MHPEPTDPPEPPDPPSILRWAFYSPRRLVLVSLALVGIVVAGVLLATPSLPPGQRAEAQHETRPSPVQGAPARATPTATPSERISVRSAARVADVARAFVDAWAGQGRPGPRRLWLRRLRPLTTAALLRGLRFTDPARLPRGHAGAVQVRQLGAFAGSALVTLSTRMAVDVELVRESGRWVVADIAPVGA